MGARFQLNSLLGLDARGVTILAASQAFGFDNSATIDGNGLVQPRFGFNYTFDTERPTQVRGGFGAGAR